MAKPELICIVEDTFQISGRHGLVIVPGLSYDLSWPLRIGDPLLLRRPDGTETRSVLAGIELISKRDLTRPLVTPIMIGPDVIKEQVPPGTEVFALQRNG